MSVLADIPERDELDGAAQLVRVRSYLKDRDGSSYVYTDDILIDNLVPLSPLQLWTAITGSEVGVDYPFTYTSIELSSPINLVRFHLGDTSEDELSYTDKEYLSMLEYLPLKYLLAAIRIYDTSDTATTVPIDRYNPISVMRRALSDTDLSAAEYTDHQLIDMLFASGVNPYKVVQSLMTEKSVSNLSSSGTLASIDGITFRDDSQVVSLEDALSVLSNDEEYSPYYKSNGLGYNVWIDGEAMVEDSEEDKWYEL